VNDTRSVDQCMHLFNAVRRCKAELSGLRGGAEVFIALATSNPLLDPWQPFRALVFSAHQIPVLFPHGARDSKLLHLRN
jgi:hypothetical protein